MSSNGMTHPLREFLQVLRRVAAVVFIAWAILTLARVSHLQQSRDEFAPPSPPFQAVTSQATSNQLKHPFDVQAAFATFIHDVSQRILYGAR